MSSNLPFSAVVLAAGHSTRMGRDKALLEVDGRPLWQRQQEMMAAAGAIEIFVSARPDQAWTRDARGIAGVLHDRIPGGGPMVGITAGLERATNALLAVVAIDLPAMTADWFRSVLTECSDAQGVVGRRGKFFEPLAAIYPRDAKWLFWEALARAQYSLQQVLATAVEKGVMRVREIGATEEKWFVNWNEPEVARPRAP